MEVESSKVMLLAAALRLAHAPAITRALPAAIGATLARFALPLAYAAMHIGLAMVQLMTVDIADLARVTSGSAATNLQIYANHLLGSAGMLAAFLAAFALALAAAAQQTRLMLLWAAGSFALALAIPLKTSAQSPFYLLVPLYYLSATLFWIASATLDAGRSRAVRATVAAALTAALMLHATGFFIQMPPYLEVARLSRNFQTALEAIRHEIARDPPSVLRFHAPADQPQAYKFIVGAPPAGPALAPYLAPPGASAATLDALRRAINASASGAGLQVRLHADMSLQALIRSPL